MFGKRSAQDEALITGLQDELQKLREQESATRQQLEELLDRVDKERLEKKFANKKAALEKELEGRRQEVEKEIADRREELERELAQKRSDAEEQMRGKVEAFSGNYNYYLSQLKLVMDMLTDSSLNVGERFLTDENADVSVMFRTEMGNAMNPEIFRDVEGNPLVQDADGEKDGVVAFEGSAGPKAAAAVAVGGAAMAGGTAEATADSAEAAGEAKAQGGADAAGGTKNAAKTAASADAAAEAAAADNDGKKKKKRKKHRLSSFMVHLISILVALAFIFLVCMIVWFFYLTFADKMGGSEALFYICDKIAQWWHAI